MRKTKNQFDQSNKKLFAIIMLLLFYHDYLNYTKV